MANNQCPLCSEINCLESTEFMYHSRMYRGIKCTNCNKMLYSYDEEAKKQTENQMDEFLKRYYEISNYQPK